MINFEIISNIVHKNFDTDFIDIKRNGIEIYSNVPCNIQINSADNPDTTAIDVVPIITSLTIHMQQYVDVQNNDYIVAKRMSKDRTILEVYTGVCGFPSVWQARKSVNMAMSTLSSIEDVTPPPPINQSEITIDYKDLLGAEIKPQTKKIVELGKQAEIYPINIDGYTLQKAYLDGKLQESNIIVIPNTSLEHNVLFEYETSTKNDYLRILSKGVYTKDDGSVGFGYHLYKKIPILSIDGENGVYELVTAVDRVLHDDNGELILKAGTKIKLFNSNEWARIASDVIKIDGGYKLSTVPYTPTESEASAVITNWYEVML